MKFTFPLGYAIQYDDNINGFVIFLGKKEDKDDIVQFPIKFDTHYEANKFIERFKYILLSDIPIVRSFADEIIAIGRKKEKDKRFKIGTATFILGGIPDGLFKKYFDKASAFWNNTLDPEEHLYMLGKYIDEIKEDQEAS